jgi:hypothetical protein
MDTLARDTAIGRKPLDAFSNALKEVAARSFIPLSVEIRSAVLRQGWKAAVDHFLSDGVLDEKEESALVEYGEHFKLPKDRLDERGEWSRIVKAAVLRDLMDGRIPERVEIDGNLILNLQKGEKIIWAFPRTEYLEDRTRRQYVGRSSGVSVRIAKGVYYKVGTFRGHPIETTETVHADTGTLVITNKHIYFAGSVKTFRVRFDKIVSFQPYDDGIGIMRDAQTAKAQKFRTGDGWFTYNLVSNLLGISSKVPLTLGLHPSLDLAHDGGHGCPQRLGQLREHAQGGVPEPSLEDADVGPV